MKEILLIIQVVLLVVLANCLESINAVFIGYYVLLYFTLKNAYSIYSR